MTERYHRVHQRGVTKGVEDASAGLHRWLSEGHSIVALPDGRFALRDKGRSVVVLSDIIHPAAFDAVRRQTR